jgi:quercetin dioxygenase-like cupin family protein
MNLLDQINLNKERPSVIIIKKTEKSKIFSVGLLKNQILKKHTASFSTLLLVLKGEITFRIHEKSFVLKEMDTFEIPVEVEHEVVGNQEENIFLLNQELN